MESRSVRAITPVCDGLRRYVVPQPIALTVKDAVEVSGIPRSGLYEALRRGDLKALKAGRRTLIPYGELQAYLASLPAFGSGE